VEGWRATTQPASVLLGGVQAGGGKGEGQGCAAGGGGGVEELALCMVVVLVLVLVLVSVLRCLLLAAVAAAAARRAVRWRAPASFHVVSQKWLRWFVIRGPEVVSSALRGNT